MGVMRKIAFFAVLSVVLFLGMLLYVKSDTTIGNPSVTKFREVKGSDDPSYTGSVPINIPL